MNPSGSPLYLGLDTGGTYTDAVLYNEERGVVAKAKALTTRHDLAIGIAEAADTVIAAAGIAPTAIGLVSLSTTLATNALVEGQGGRAALVMIGFSPADLSRDGLGEALGNDPVIFLPGGHDVYGRETPLETNTLQDALPGLAGSVSGFAIAGYFAVRNPAHEIAVRDLIRAATHLPVTCSHELSSKLGGPRRALTTLLNARLVSMIDRLVGACSGFLAARGIDAPLMVVRGDGALMSAAEAGLRPIETILSGPAASLVGARHLTGLDRAVVSDIGGTTTDVAILEDGRPRLDAEGAVVGGHRTMVEAVAMRTFGLGGDSEVHLDDGGLAARFRLGPRRLVPLSLAAALHGEPVLGALARQVRSDLPGRLDGRFAWRAGLPDRFAAGLSDKEALLYDKLADTPQPLDQLLASTAQRATLDRLVGRGLAMISGFTPSDALHVLGRQERWSRDAAELGARLFARRKDGAGRPVAPDAQTLAVAIVDRLTRQSAEAVLTACLAEDNAEIDPAKSIAVDRALTRAPGIAQFALSLDRPLIGLGASAPVYYPAIAEMLGAQSTIPADADVANAIGAVVGQVRSTVTIIVTSPETGLFAVAAPDETRRFSNEDAALDFACETARQTAVARANASGADAPAVTLSKVVEAPEADGQRTFVEARITATASGRPRSASR